MPKNITLLLCASGLMLAGSCYAEGHSKADVATLNLGPHTIKDLKVDGAINVQLSNKRYANVMIKGQPGSLSQLQEQITTDGLAVTNAGNTPVTLYLAGNSLQNLIVNNGSVSSDRLTIKHPLRISNNGLGNIDLHGMLNVSRISAHDASHTTISWLNSSDLAIIGSGMSQLNLDGKADTANIRLSNNSTYNGRSLTVNNMRIQTADRAIANVFSKNSLRAFAENNSGIYYINTPQQLTQNSKDSANILALR